MRASFPSQEILWLVKYILQLFFQFHLGLISYKFKQQFHLGLISYKCKQQFHLGLISCKYKQQFHLGLISCKCKQQFHLPPGRSNKL